MQMLNTTHYLCRLFVNGKKVSEDMFVSEKKKALPLLGSVGGKKKEI